MGRGLPSHFESGVWEETGSVAECAHLSVSVPGNGSSSLQHFTAPQFCQVQPWVGIWGTRTVTTQLDLGL